MTKLIKRNQNTADFEKIRQELEAIPEELLSKLTFSMQWQYDEDTNERRGSEAYPFDKNLTPDDRDKLQTLVEDKYHKNPHINTAVRGLAGRMTGYGFSCTSEVWEIQEAIEEIEEDPRNRLYHFWPKYIEKYLVDGEMYKLFTLHKDGFVEVDFIDPSLIKSSGIGGEDGIIWHPQKALFPLFYCINNGKDAQLVPSINIARYPKDLVEIAKKQEGWNEEIVIPREKGNTFSKIGGFRHFIVSWDRGLMTKRAVSFLRTTLQWLNYYEDLKKYEIDHKKSAGAYVWVFKFEDIRSFKNWLALSNEDRRKTGVLAKTTPGSKLFLPPGMTIEAQFPNLTRISDSDTDIMHMITAGLGEPEDVTTGQAKGTYASLKASRGPMSDRTSDEIAYFERYLRFDFWGSIFFLKSAIGKFPETFKVKRAIGFKNQEPVFKNIQRRPEKLIEISFPSSEVTDMESRAKALLGVKHGRLSDGLGIPNSEIAKKLGFAGYGSLRLLAATEDEKYPELVPEEDQESVQEREEAEPSRPVLKKRKQTKSNDKEGSK